MNAPIFSNHGCRLNQYELEAMKELAEGAGLRDAVVINTCAVTAEAVRKARQDIRKLRKANPDARLIVTGCAAQTEPATFTAMPEVDAVIGNTEKMLGETWQGLAADFIGETEALQVDDIMSVTETAGHLAAVPMCRFKTAVITAAPFASFPMVAAIPALSRRVWSWTRSSGWWTRDLTKLFSPASISRHGVLTCPPRQNWAT